MPAFPFRFTLLLLTSAPVIAATGVVPSSPGNPPEQRSTLDDQQSVAITIYNEDLALVKEVRKVSLDAGANRVALRDVSAKLRPETALLRSVSHPGSFSVVEQNFDYNLLTPEVLLEKAVGQTVRVVRTNPSTGIETVESAQVLAATQGVVLKIGDRIETGVPGRIVFDNVPAKLRDRPTLVADLSSRQAGTQQVELSYLSGGLSWKADYVAELSADDTTLDLNGWVTLHNDSGTTYNNAKLQLVAGDVNRVREMVTMAVGSLERLAAPQKAAAPMAQESLFEYHLYTLGRPTTVSSNQSKQVALLGAAGVPMSKELVLQGEEHHYRDAAGEIGRKLKVGVFVQFDNRDSSRLGVPMPKGIVRVYKRDSAGHAQFIGEDRIDHTPKNDMLRLRLGQAFDVTADKVQTDFKRLDRSGAWNVVTESAYEVTLHNAKSEAVTVVVREPVPGDWKMLQESHKHEKVAVGTAQWRVSVPANGKTSLKYRVNTRW